jgi:hypothetical protein
MRVVAPTRSCPMIEIIPPAAFEQFVRELARTRATG